MAGLTDRDGAVGPGGRDGAVGSGSLRPAGAEIPAERAVWQSGAARGQLLLLTAIGMAVLLVALTLALNGAHHSGAVATRGGVDDRPVLAYQAAVADAGGDLLAATNRENHSSYERLDAAVASHVANWSGLSGGHAASDGQARHAAVTDTTNGTRVRQTNATLAFSGASGDSSWTVADDASGVRGFHALVDSDALAEGPVGPNVTPGELAAEGAFAVALDNGTVRWRAFVYRNGTDAVVAVENHSGALAAPCRATPTDGTVAVNVTRAALGGQSCPALSSFGAIEAPFALAFERGESAVGTYSLVVDRPLDAVDDGDVVTTGDDRSPVATRALYSARLSLSVVAPGLAYETSLRIAPGEPP